MAKSLREHRAGIKPAVRAAARSKAVAVLAEMSLAETREARGEKQVGIAERLGLAQSNVSKIENQSDALVSTLGNYIEALGGELELIAKFPDGQLIEITQFKNE